jgi:hypothetical protein
MFVLFGFHAAQPTTIKLCGKRCVQICCSVRTVMVKAACHGSSLVLKHGSITLNPQTKGQPVESHHATSPRKTFKATHSIWEVMATVFWDT